MTLSCSYDDGEIYYYFNHTEVFVLLKTKRRKRCSRCNKLIHINNECLIFTCFRQPRTEIEERILGEDVFMANKYMCEHCGWIHLTLYDPGFFLSLASNMDELVKEYNHD